MKAPALSLPPLPKKETSTSAAFPGTDMPLFNVAAPQNVPRSELRQRPSLKSTLGPGTKDPALLHFAQNVPFLLQWLK